MRPNDGLTISREEREAKLTALLAAHHSHGFEAQCECAFCHLVRIDPQEARAVRRATARSLGIGLALTVLGVGLQIAILQWRYATLTALWIWILQRDEFKLWRRWWALRRFV